MIEYKRKLIEVALPLEAINNASAREKSIRHGHPSTLHLWWARRPLAACRAVLFSSLVDDPSAHPDQFPTEASQEAERMRLFGIIEELITWENSNNERVLASARAEILRSCAGDLPTVLDPFCGGGSIPLEAQRLGLQVHAADLNPVAVLITKALVEIPPKFADKSPINPAAQEGAGLRTWVGAQGLADDVRYYGHWMLEEARQRIGHLYPQVRLTKDLGGGEANVVAWIWARTVHCPNPACGAVTPLLNSMALSAKSGRERWLKAVVLKDRKAVRFDIGVGPSVPEPPKLGRGANFRCLVCESVIGEDHIKAEGTTSGLGAQLVAVVADGNARRLYLPAEASLVPKVGAPNWQPEEELADEPRSIWCKPYGLTHFSDLFTGRQLIALTTLVDLVAEASQAVRRDGGTSAYADAVATYLALAIGRLANRCSSQSIWNTQGEKVEQVFAHNSLQMVWVYAEANPFSDSSGNFGGQLEYLVEALVRTPASGAATVIQADATSGAEWPDSMVVTDPPYYDNVPYAVLSDFFYVWLRRCLKSVDPELFGTILVPKAEELVADPYRQHSREAAAAFFEAGLLRAFRRMLAAQRQGFPATVFYAFKQSEDDGSGDGSVSTGWDTMLSSLLAAGFQVTGTWPIRTERKGGLRDLNRGALASSIVLVCRQRQVSAPVANRKDFLAALHADLPNALRRLQQGYVAPVDLAQAAIGPGMAVFSRYARIIEADGSAMSVRTALGMINRVLDATLAEQDEEFDANTRWAVAWFEQFGMSAGEFGVAEILSKAKNSAVNALVDAGIVQARAGKVVLIARNQLETDWDPASEASLSIWVVTQHLIRALEAGGESAAAELVGQVGGLAETARELAYRLYNICERKRWAKEALSYNGLVVAWPAILRIAAEQPDESVQLTLGS